MIIHPARTFRVSGERVGSTFQCQLKISICINRKWFPFPLEVPRKESELFSLAWLVTSRHKDKAAKHGPGNCIIEVLFWWAISSVSFWLLCCCQPRFLNPFQTPTLLTKRGDYLRGLQGGGGEIENRFLDTEQMWTANKKYTGVF